MGFFSFLVLLLLLLMGETALYKHFSLTRLDYDCRFSCDEAMEGDTVELIETIQNRKSLPEPWLKSEITTSKWLQFAGSQSIVTDKTRVVPSFFVVKSYQKLRRSWRVTCLQRGEFALQKVGLVSSDLLGTVNLSHAVPVDAQLTVLPKGLALDAFVPLPHTVTGEVVVRHSLVEDPFVLSGVREYTQREQLNQIHWSATAKEGRLMVHNREHTASQNLTVILNMQSMPYEVGAVVQEAEAENAIRVCAALFEQTLAEQLPVQFFANASTTEERRPTVSGEYFGEAFVHELLRILAKLRLESTDDIAVYLNDIFDHVQSTDCVLVTPYLNQAMQRFAAEKTAQGGRVRIYVTGRVSASMLTGDCEVYCLQDVLEEGGWLS